MPIRTNRGRAAVYRRIWGAPLRSPKHLVATVVVLVVLVTAIGFLIPRMLPGDGNAAPGLAGQTGQTGATSGAQTTGTTEPQEVTETRLTESPLTPKSAPPAPAALVVARQWAEAWVDHPKGTTSKQWLAGLEPLTTEEFLPQLESVDVRNIPAEKVVGKLLAVGSTTSSVDVDVRTDGPTLRITVIKRPDGWRVDRYAEES
ncbi:MAG: hypothetical protein ACRDQB_04640 [Thermocrispum sp.]